MNNTKNMKKLFYRNVMVIFAMLTCIALINYTIDPDEERLEDYQLIAELFFEGNSIEIRAGIEERLFKKTIIEKLIKPVDTFVVGSSRVMTIHKELLELNMFNAGVSGAGLEDQMAMLDIYTNKFGLPKKVIMGIDPWVFKLTSDKENSFVSDHYEHFKSKVLGILTSEVKNKDKYISNWKKTTRLLEIIYLKESMKILLKEPKHYNTIADVDLENSIGHIFVKEDASLIYSKKYRLEKNGKGWREQLDYRLSNFSTMDEGLTNEFDKVIDYLYDNDVEIEIYLPPYNPLLYNELVTNYPQYYAIIKIVEDYIIEKSHEGKFTVVGSYNPELKTLKENDFYDGVHLKRENLSRYFSANPELSMLKRLEQ